MIMEGKDPSGAQDSIAGICVTGTPLSPGSEESPLGLGPIYLREKERLPPRVQSQRNGGVGERNYHYTSLL